MFLIIFLHISQKQPIFAYLNAVPYGDEESIYCRRL